MWSDVGDVHLVEPGLEVRREGVEVDVGLGAASNGLRGGFLGDQLAGLLEVPG
ncbi:hypothetical protein OHA18_37135 [Kribbella sp. NBC_00709]|uniref:hypothetical protein n=1 Tax=Kribbella sp. NBC_00709 TaxID=2975972 RepID=UPI002E2902F6|nr:hypothetical protein [Kribbella sp. NBC_00709]